MILVDLFPPAGHWPVALSKLAVEMGVSERTLTDAARSGELQAWRVGGKTRGELVTTLPALTAYLAAQPAHTPKAPKTVALKQPTPYELMLAAAEAKPLRAPRRAA